MKFDNLIIILSTFILTSCINSNSQDVNGYWYGTYNDSGKTSPLLYNFNDGILKNCFYSYNDTIRYKVKGKKLLISSDDPNNIWNRYSIKFKNDRMKFYYNNDYAWTIHKSVSENFVLDYLNNKQVKITLPESTQKGGIFDKEYRFDTPLYFGTINNELVVHFYNTTVKFDNNFYKAIFANQDLLYNIKNSNYPIALVADKNISVKALKNLFKQLSSLHLTYVTCITMPEEYAEINYRVIEFPEISLTDEMMYNDFKQKLVNENPSYYDNDNYEDDIISPDDFSPAPAGPPKRDIETLIKEGIVLIGSTSNGFIFNNNKCTPDELRDKIKAALLSNPDVVISYYISNSLTCQDYVDLIGLIDGVCSELRNDYLTKTYGESHKKIKNVFLKNRGERMLYQIKVNQLNLTEYKKIVNALIRRDGREPK